MTRRRRTWLIGLATAAIVVAANASAGAYFSQSWGWVALAFLVPVGAALILGVVEVPGRLRIAFASLVAALAAWTAVSAAWSVSVPASIRESERALVYVAVALALVLLLRTGDAPAVAGGAFAGTVAIAAYGLATRLFPERFDAYDAPGLPYRLSEPIGYWNAFGLLAAIGVLLALGVAAHARRVHYRIASGLVLPVLATALYFAFSRGSWAALAVGFLAAVALDPRRVRLLWTTLALAPASAGIIYLASRQDALTNEDAPVADAVAQGERLAAWLLAAIAASGALAALATAVARRVVLPPRARRGLDVALGIAFVAAVVVAVVARGGPGEAFSDVKERFDAPLVTGTPGSLNERLFNLSGTGRSDSLRVAWELASERPVLGYGSGSYEYKWYERRPDAFVIRDAHSLYAEMWAEVGLVGLALLVAALCVPVAAAIRARRTPLVAAAAGSYVAWAAHSALDWDWEIPGVTAGAFLCAGVALLAADRRRRGPLSETGRVPLTAAVVVLSVVGVVSLVGNQALFAAQEAVARRDFAGAATDAQRAGDLLSWSHEPDIALGDAAAGLGDREGALAAYRRATATDPDNWVAWLRVAQLASGDERTRAYARVRALNPQEEKLPGERRRDDSPRRSP